jgi:hypothetical protein
VFQLEKSLGDCDLVDTVKTVICSDPCRCLLQRSDIEGGIWGFFCVRQLPRRR